MLETWILVVSAFVGLAGGTLIGAVGVGGIIIVPILVELPGIKIYKAIAAAMFSYIFVGIAGGYAFQRSGKVNWPSLIWLLVGATPGGFGGAFLLNHISGTVVKLVLYALILASSLFSLYLTFGKKKEAEVEEGVVAEGEDDADALNQRTTSYMDAQGSQGSVQAAPAPDTPATESSALQGGVYGDDNTGTVVGKAQRIALGFIDGFGSALTGTSGPVVLLPMLFIGKWDIHDAAGSAQLVQFPIALAATIATAALGKEDIDFALGGCIAAGIVPGAFIGTKIAFALPKQTLKQVVAIVLAVAAVFLVGKLIVTDMLPDDDDDDSNGNSTNITGGFY